MAQLDLLHDTVLAEDMAAQLPVPAVKPARNREKSPEAMLTISEVAAELGEETHVLRFWETRFTQLQPIKMKGGRRHYKPADVQLLRVIRALLHERGYTIKGAQALLAAHGNPMDALNAPMPDETVAPAALPVSDGLGDKGRETLQNALAELEQMRSILRSFR